MKRDELIDEINSWKKPPKEDRLHSLSRELDALANRKGVGEALLALCERFPNLEAVSLNAFIREMPGFPETAFASIARTPSSLALTALFLGVGFPDGVPLDQKKRAAEVFRDVAGRKDIKAAIRNDAKGYCQLTERKIAAAAPSKPSPTPVPKTAEPTEIATLKQLVDFLHHFEPSEDEYENEEALDKAVEAWEKLGKPEKAQAAMLKVFERFPECDLLGNPGPLVHALESAGDSYQKKLLASVKKTPSYYGLWMLNRIINSTDSPKQAAPLVKLLRAVANDEAAPLSLRANAERYLE